MCDQFYRDGEEIKLNYAKLVTAYNTMKLKTNERICALEMELEKSNGLVECLNDRRCNERVQHEEELKALRLELDELNEKINKMFSIETYACSCRSVSTEKTDWVEKCSDNNQNISDTFSYASATCESCIFHKTQIDELNNKICDLTEAVKERTTALQGSERLNKAFSRTLDENTKLSEEKNRDLKTLAYQLKHCMVKCSDLWTKLQTANERINSAENKNSELTNRLYEAEEELKNLQSHLTIKLTEIEYDKNQEIQEHIKFEKEFENKLVIEEEKLKKCEELKNLSDKRCDDLMVLNQELQNMLDYQKEENRILDETVKKLKYSYEDAGGKVQYLRINLKICAENLKSSMEENWNLKEESELIFNKMKCNEKMLLDTELKLNNTIEENSNLKSKIDKLNEKIKCCENVIHETELKLNEESSQNKNLKSDLVTLSNECKKLTEINNTLCRRIDDLEVTQSKELQDQTLGNESDSSKQSNVSEKTDPKSLSIQINTFSAVNQMSTKMSNNHECLRHSGRSETSSDSGANCAQCARPSMDVCSCSAGCDVSKREIAENEKLRHQLSQQIETIQSIQRKSENAENELKEQCSNMAKMLIDQFALQEKVLKNQIKAQNKIIKNMNDNFKNYMEEKTQTFACKENSSQRIDALDSKKNLVTPREVKKSSSSKRNVMIPSARKMVTLYDESSGDKDNIAKTKLIKELAQQLEIRMREKRET